MHRRGGFFETVNDSDASKVTKNVQHFWVFFVFDRSPETFKFSPDIFQFLGNKKSEKQQWKS